VEVGSVVMDKSGVPRTTLLEEMASARGSGGLRFDLKLLTDVVGKQSILGMDGGNWNRWMDRWEDGECNTMDLGGLSHHITRYLTYLSPKEGVSE